MTNQFISMWEDDERSGLPSSSHTASLSTMFPSGGDGTEDLPFLPTISPDIESRQRPLNDNEIMMHNSIPWSCGKNTGDENNGTCILKPEKSPKQTQSEIPRGQEQLLKTNMSMAKFSPMMVTPDANATSKSVAARTSTYPNSNTCARPMTSGCVVSPPLQNVYAYQTPQKQSHNISASPCTGVTPFLNDTTTIRAHPSSTTLPSYSPITPNTSTYMKRTSPFRSYMQLFDEELHSFTEMEKELSNKIHEFDQGHYHDDDYNNDDEDEDSISFSPKPSCSAQQMLNETYYYSARTSTTSCPQSNIMQFHTPNQHHQTANPRSTSFARIIHHWNNHLYGGGGDDDDGHREQQQHYSDSFIRRRCDGEDDVKQYRSASYDNSDTRQLELVDFESLHATEHHAGQQKKQQHTPMSMDDDILISRNDSSPVEFRRVLWREGEETATTPSSPCRDAPSHYSESADSRTAKFETLNCKKMQYIRKEMTDASTEETATLLSSSHVTALQELRTALESTSLVELERSRIDANRTDLEKEKCERSEMHMVELPKWSEESEEESFECSDHEGEMNSLASDSVDQGARHIIDERSDCSGINTDKNEGVENQEQQQQLDASREDSLNEISFYIGEEEGFTMFESIEESDISETDGSCESSFERFSVDENDVGPGEDVGSMSKHRDCQNFHCLEHRSKLQFAMEENERMKNELERLKTTHYDHIKLLSDNHRDELERLRAETASSTSRALDFELNYIDRLKDELSVMSACHSNLVLQHENMRLEYSAEISSLEKNKLEVEAKVESLQMKMEEKAKHHFDEICNLKATLDKERTLLISEHMSIVRSIKEDFESKLDVKNRKIEMIEETHREHTAEQSAQSIQDANQLADANAAKTQCEEQNQAFLEDLNDMNTKLTFIIGENDYLASNLATALADKESLSMQLTRSEDEKGAISQQLESVRLERNDLLVQVASLEGMLSEAVARQATFEATLNDASTELKSQSNEVTELKEQLASRNMLLKTIQDDFERTVNEKDNKLSEIEKQYSDKSAENNAHVSHLESRLKSSIEEKEKIDAQLDTAHNELCSSLAQVARMKDTLAESVAEINIMKVSLHDARREIECQCDRIGGMETDRLSLLCQISELEQQMVAKDTLLKSIQDEFDGYAVAHATQVSQLKEHLTSTRSENELLEERNQMLTSDLDRTNAKLAAITCENVCLSSNLATAEADNSTLLLRATRIENENAFDEEQLAKVRADRDDLVVQVTNLKGSLDEAYTKNESTIFSLNDIRLQVKDRNDRIASMETERFSLSNQITELEQQIASQSIIIEKMSMETTDQSNKMTCLHDSVTNLEHLLSSKDTGLVELSTANDDLVNKFLMLVKEHEGAISEKNSLVMEQSSMILSLEAQLSSLEKEKSELFESCRVLRAKDGEITALALTENLAEDVETARVIPGISVSERDSSVDFRFNRNQDLDRTISSMNSESQDLLDKIDHFQGLAAELAVSVLKLKLQGNEHDDKMIKDRASFNEQFLALSEKGTEIRWLYAKVMDKTGVLFDLRQENDQLMKENMRMLREYQSKAATLEVDRTLIEQLQLENQRLNELNSNLRSEKEAASKLRSQLVLAEEALSELRAAMLPVNSNLEGSLQGESHLSHQVDSLHDSIVALEQEKKSLSGCVHDYKQKAAQLSYKVNMMENEATSNAIQILELESQLVSKMNRLKVSSNNSHDSSLVKVRAPSLDIQDANVKVAISSLRSNIDNFIQEFENIVVKLDVTVNELNDLRDSSIAAPEVITPMDMEAEPPLDKAHIDISPPKELGGRVSEADLDRVRTFMATAQQITAKSERERKLLENEVKRLRADLERAEKELVSVRDDALTMSRMRHAVSQSKTLLEKAEREKNQLEVSLANTRKEMEQIQMAASESYNSIIKQSKDEINKLKMENESIKSFISGSMETSISSNHKQSVVSQISSVEKFKIEKGQSMFDILKGTKKSGRKDNLKYRRTEE